MYFLDNNLWENWEKVIFLFTFWLLCSIKLFESRESKNWVKKWGHVNKLWIRVMIGVDIIPSAQKSTHFLKKLKCSFTESRLFFYRTTSNIWIFWNYTKSSLSETRRGWKMDWHLFRVSDQRLIKWFGKSCRIFELSLHLNLAMPNSLPTSFA